MKLRVLLDLPSNFAFNIRIPYFADGATYQVNDGTSKIATADEFLVIEREWQSGDVVTLNIPLPLEVQANDQLAAVVRGTLVYCLFQDLQDKKGTIFWHRGIYPEDNQLALDIDYPEKSIWEEPTREDLLGPALRIDGQIMSRAPMFSTQPANEQTIPAEPQSFILVPFANQGAIRGPYRIFNNYRMPPQITS